MGESPWQTGRMPRSKSTTLARLVPSRLTAVLLALALATAACADSSDNAAVDNAQADGAEADGASVQQPDGGAADAPATNIPDSADRVAPGEQFAPVAITGASLEAMPQQIPVTEPGNDASIGVVAPEIVGTGFDGAPVTVTADGTAKMVMFVAHWCPHCQREIPVVKDLIDQGLVPDGLEIVVVSTAVRDGDPNFPPQAWLEDEQWPGPVLRDSPEFEALFAFGAGGFPYTVYLDSEHRVVTRTAGEIPADVMQQLWLATVDA